MEYFAYIAIGFVIFQWVNVSLNVLFPQKMKSTGGASGLLISVLIPARNEEDNIGLLLGDLQRTTNLNLEIIVCDDGSTDKTASIITKYADADSRISFLKSKPLPDGWLGKNHACYQLAEEAKGHFLLFLDADVRTQGDVIKDAVAYLEKHHLGLLSVFPTQIQKTLGEKLTVPIMNYILLTLLPLVFVRVSPFRSHSAANGQFMLFKAHDYQKHQAHRRFKASLVEDIAIAHYFKKQSIKIACISGEKRIRCRMYTNYQEALNGFSKNIFMFFGDNRLLAILFWGMTTFGFIPVMLSFSHLIWSYFATLITIQIAYSYLSKQAVLLNLLLFPAQLFFMLQLMIISIQNKGHKHYLWKGRNIYT